MATKASDAETTAKRRVKNPETFREKALKASEAGDKLSKRQRVRGGAASGFAKVFGPIGRALQKFFGFKAFRPLRRPVRLVGLILLPPYFRKSWRELKLVEWPSWPESRRLTFAVLVFAFVFGASVAVVDYGLDKLFREVLLK
ncbi:MAG: Protein translocase subunit SecE [Candidatus Saccharibacteria bacterium]|nr:Protein translocase subunit SecE [Candidatus Saccharibacteria bacterium]